MRGCPETRNLWDPNNLMRAFTERGNQARFRSGGPRGFAEARVFAGKLAAERRTGHGGCGCGGEAADRALGGVELGTNGELMSGGRGWQELGAKKEDPAVEVLNCATGEAEVMTLGRFFSGFDRREKGPQVL